MSKFIRAILDCQRNRWVHRNTGLYESATPLTRGDTYHFQLQLLNPPYDASAYGYNGLVGMKTWANFNSGGDFAAAWAGFDTGDPYNAPASGQYSIPLIVPYSLSLCELVTNVVLFQSSGTKLEAPVFRSRIQQALYQGTETNIPAGIPGQNTGIATISGQNTSVVVTVTGLTTLTGKAICTPEVSTGGFTMSTCTVTGANQFTITVPQPPEIVPGDGRQFLFTYWVIRL